MNNVFMDNAKVMSKGQVTIPKEVRQVLGVESGDRVSFIVEGNNVRIVNAAVYAMQIFQNQMKKELRGMDISDEEILDMVMESRSEG